MVKVEYDPARVTYRDLAKRVKNKGWFAVPDGSGQCETASEVFGRKFESETPQLRDDRDPKYYLLQTVYRHVPMTELQQVRVNAQIHGGNPKAVLSPRQQQLLAKILAHPKAAWPLTVGQDFSRAWYAAHAVDVMPAKKK